MRIQGGRSAWEEEKVEKEEKKLGQMIRGLTSSDRLARGGGGIDTATAVRGHRVRASMQES